MKEAHEFRRGPAREIHAVNYPGCVRRDPHEHACLLGTARVDRFDLDGKPR